MRFNDRDFSARDRELLRRERNNLAQAEARVRTIIQYSAIRRSSRGKSGQT
jgi:hypothetical protein